MCLGPLKCCLGSLCLVFERSSLFKIGLSVLMNALLYCEGDTGARLVILIWHPGENGSLSWINPFNPHYISNLLVKGLPALILD